MSGEPSQPGTSRGTGLVGWTRAAVKDTPLERPARALARRVREIVGVEPGPVDERPAAVDDAARDDVPLWVPPGHFYSPIPSRADIEEHRRRVDAGTPPTLGGIELRLDAQAALLDSFAPFYAEQPFAAQRSDATRYWFENPSFGYADALALYSMLRLVRPRRIIEVGSGWSSCVMLDTCERFLDPEPELVMIEPFPEQLHQLLWPGDLDRIRLVDRPVQQVPLDEFRTLERGDVLFIDSTHVTRVGSDVNYEVFEILPALAAGVYVHFHDIFYPFDYPIAWVEEGRGWNEAYVLRAFLEYNDTFEIVLWNDLVGHRLRERLTREYPLWVRNYGGSIWLRKRD